MPALNEIINIINCSISGNNLSSKKFQNGLYSRIADPVKVRDDDSKETIEPMIVNNFGESISLVFSDNYPFQIFHILDFIEYEEANVNFGKPGNMMKEEANLRLIFSGSRKLLQLTKEDIIPAIIYDFPKEFNSTTICAFNLNSCRIEMSEVSVNPYDVWSENWKGYRTMLDPEIILFSIKYKIISIYSSCYNLC